MHEAITDDLFDRLALVHPFCQRAEFTHAEVLAQAVVMVAEERERADMYEAMWTEALAPAPHLRAA